MRHGVQQCEASTRWLCNLRWPLRHCSQAVSFVVTEEHQHHASHPFCLSFCDGRRRVLRMSAPTSPTVCFQTAHGGVSHRKRAMAPQRASNIFGLQIHALTPWAHSNRSHLLRCYHWQSPSQLVCRSKLNYKTHMWEHPKAFVMHYRPSYCNRSCCKNAWVTAYGPSPNEFSAGTWKPLATFTNITSVCEQLMSEHELVQGTGVAAWAGSSLALRTAWKCCKSCGRQIQCASWQVAGTVYARESQATLARKGCIERMREDHALSAWQGVG